MKLVIDGVAFCDAEIISGPKRVMFRTGNPRDVELQAIIRLSMPLAAGIPVDASQPQYVLRDKNRESKIVMRGNVSPVTLKIAFVSLWTPIPPAPPESDTKTLDDQG